MGTCKTMVGEGDLVDPVKFDDLETVPPMDVIAKVGMGVCGRHDEKDECSERHENFIYGFY